MLSKIQHRLKPTAERPLMALLMILVIAISNVGVGVKPAQAVVGQGFTVTPADLAYILKQIKIAEYHAANTTSLTGLCGALVGPGANQIPSPLLSFGLRTVDGSCNNLQPGQDTYGAADQTFPRLTTPEFRQAEANPPLFGPPAGTSYAQTTGNVFDSQPRDVSNLVVDQTSTNPAAIFAAGFPVRTQGNEGVVPCDANGLPTGCVPAHETLFIPNVTTDVGLSPPFNSLFTIFGQFFDHGLDKITNGGAGAVFVPLKDDDPLVAGPDHDFGTTGDNLPANQRFMVVTRGKIVNDANGVRNAPNTDTPFIDQSQTYTSHSSHQVFVREYVLSAGKPVATGKFLSEADGGIASWATVKTQVAAKLGLQLVDADVNNIPMIAADQYGNFIPGPNGFPQYVTTSVPGLVEGDPAANGGLGVLAPGDVVRINTAFLNDIAHSAAPTAGGPDSDTVAGGSLDTPVPAGTYDDELLDLHFICGDGRCNENIGLTAVHQIFHMEHDRLADDITATLNANPSLLAAYQTVNLAAGSNKTFTFGERLFQAARFVTEMEYQHLVFEEFGRKVQPAINPFEPFAFGQTDLNPAITAEFAHAVYRFGHSMLTETLPRINAPGLVTAGAPLHNDIDLFDGFLNPAAFYQGGNNVTLTSQQATASLIMGLSDQVGNEIDEFVTDVLRNHLVGLPLDLPSINMARARSEGIPRLNNVRKQIFAATNDGQLTPYGNWVDFRENIKHPVSLVNFIAAYGKHPAITTLDPDGAGPILAGSLEARRMAADQIVNGTTLPGPDNTLGTADDIFAPTDNADFMFSTGAWANAGDVSITGLDDVDLWVGGLAENTNLFGGLLGPTFNYVFEKQLTDLQNGDRLYYLARTPGMNLRTQLEGNSFAELIMRNTSPYTFTLKADPFATADCKFELANLSATPQGFINFGSTVADDLTTDCNETALLIRLPDGTIKYRSVNSVDPVGINGQSVYNGTDFADEFFGGNDNDTFWGGLGDDTIEGGGGDDVSLGGEGDDIITDSAGADFLKGGPGNDAIDGGIGDDIILGGDGKDFTNGGGNINETFSGPGDDFAIAGQGTDAVFGDSGDDWIEGGDQPDLLIGDSSSLFFDDHNLPGHDIIIGQGGDDDYDMEGGDDIGVAGPGVEKVAGASGYDWEIGLGDPQPQNSDLDLLIVNVPPVNETRDRYNEIEALSGWKFNDTLRGDSIIPSQVGGLGFIGCDALDTNGVARINGLDTLVPAAIRTVPFQPIIDASVTNYCLLTSNVWGEGNILLGGAGSDTLEGRGADDILDGDKYLSVRLSVRAPVVNNDGTGPEIGSTGLMENAAVTGNFGPGTAGMTLQQAVFARNVNPGNIVAVREILTPPVVPADCGAATPLNCDTAEFSGPQVEYTITSNANGSVTVTDLADPAAAAPIVPAVPRNTDGIDTLWNIEQLSFCTTPGVLRGTCDLRAAPVSIAPAAGQSIASLTPTPTRGFGNVLVGTSLRRTVILSNTGTGPMSITGIAVTGTGFSRAAGGCGASVAAGASCNIFVNFAPATGGPKTGTLTVTDNSNGVPGSVQTVALRGTGTIVANADTRTVTANGLVAAQVITQGVRANDIPANVGTVTIVNSSFTSGATATATVSANQVVWTLTPTGGTTTATRQALKRGTYTVNYRLTNGGATATATYTLTVN